jgi:undecaprenyl-diphosphatase
MLSTVVAITARPNLDYPVTLFINRFVTQSLLLDYMVEGLTELDLLKGVVIVAGVWLVWFDAPEPDSRARLAAGVIAASFAALVSRGLQLVLPQLPRPVDDAAISIVSPLGSHPLALKEWSSFPSDHGSLLFGIAMAIAIVRPSVGVAAFGWALLVTLARLYSGLHFFSDVTGAASLGVALVCLSQIPAIRSSCLIFTNWANERAGMFYATAFVVSYSLATLFDDIRSMAKGLAQFLGH